MADDKVSISLQLLGLRVDLPTRVVVVTFELFIHCSQEVLHGNKRVNKIISGVKGLRTMSVTVPTRKQASSRRAMIPVLGASTKSQIILLLK